MRTALLHSLAVLFLLAGCATPPPPADATPDWVSGPSPRYPSRLFLTGVGEGPTRKSAEDAAYGALSRIFVASIDQKTRELESYLQKDSEGQSTALRSIEIAQVTAVSTRKILEDVRIAETWKEDATGRIVALAVLDRTRASSALRARIADRDTRIRTYLSEADPSEGKLRAAGNLYKAVQSLLVREAYNADLRIVDPDGEGVAPPVSIARVTQEFRDLIRRQIITVLRTTGARSGEIRPALIEGLARYGLRVLADDSDAEGAAPTDILIQAHFDFQTVANPRYELIRWTADFEVSDPGSGKVIGSFSKSGREGHLSLPEAENRAVRALKDEASGELSDRLAEFIFGKAEKSGAQ